MRGVLSVLLIFLLAVSSVHAAIENPCLISQDSTTSNLLGSKQRCSVSVDSTKYSVNLKSFDSQKAVVDLGATIKNLNLEKDMVFLADLNNDEVLDISLRYTGSKSNKAQIVIKEFDQEAIETSYSEIAPSNLEVSYSPSMSDTKYLWGLAILVVVIAAFIFFRPKKKKNKKSR